MSPALLRYIAALLNQGADNIFRRICEDHDERAEAAQEALTPEERDNLMREYHEWNGDPEEFEPGRFTSQASIASCACAVLLRKVAEEMETTP
jgi:hypothetical protein